MGKWKYYKRFLENGVEHGIIQEITYNDDGYLLGIYDGEMKMGVLDGWGTETLYDDGYFFGTYVGNFKNDDYNGWGIFIYADGTIEKGIFRNGDLLD